MKKILAFIVLFSHMNFFMLPKVEAAESLAICNIHPIDYTNNIVEFVDEVILGNEDETPGKEDNKDRGFEMEESADYFFCHYLLRVDHSKFDVIVKELSTLSSTRLTIPCFEKVSPPPEA